MLPDTVGICSLTTNQTRRFHELWDIKMLLDQGRIQGICLAVMTPPTKKIFFECNLLDWPIRLSR